MPNRHPLTLKDFIKKLKRYGVVPMARSRGKGSEIILLKPDSEGSTKGAQYPIKNHGKKTTIQVPVIKAAIRRFEIDEAEFWS
jgi:hypothetical protein